MTESTSGDASVDIAELLAVLADEQGALEHLLFKLREQNMVLSSGEHRWLSQSTAEVESAVHVLTATGRRREDVAARVHRAHGLAADSKITSLASRLGDELTCQQLLQRQRTLRDVLDQVRRCSRQNRELLAQGLAATNDALALLGSVPTYDSFGGVTQNGRPACLNFDTRV